MYAENFTENVTGLLPLIEGVNDAAGGWLFGTVLLALWLLFIISSKESSFANTLLASSFLMAIISGILFGAGLINSWVLSFALSGLVLGLILKVWGEG